MLQILFPLLILFSLFSEEKTTNHSIELGEKTLCYTVTAAAGPVGYIAYIKEGKNRPITFAFNGGPGSSSVWLHIGAFGPRRAISPEEGQSATPPYQVIDNLETILDLTDLVFIDPPGTGLAAVPSKEAQKELYSTSGDIKAVGCLIRDYLTKHQRWNSPKYIAGESYGAMRAAGLAEYLQNEFGIYLNGLILVSPAIDYQTFLFNPDNPLPFFLYLPSYAATAWYHGLYMQEASLEEAVQTARQFAYANYALALLCPKQFDLEDLYPKLAQISALPEEFVRRCRGHIYDSSFHSEFLSAQGKSVGMFDSRVVAAARPFDLLKDPSIDEIEGIFSGAFHNYLQTELKIPHSYTLFSLDVSKNWDHDIRSFGGPNLMNSLRNALQKNPHLKIFVGSGYFDLVTPFASAEYCIDHLSVPDSYVEMHYYEGGHMYYLNPKERIKFKQDLVQFYGKEP